MGNKLFYADLNVTLLLGAKLLIKACKEYALKFETNQSSIHEFLPLIFKTIFINARVANPDPVFFSVLRLWFSLTVAYGPGERSDPEKEKKNRGEFRSLEIKSDLDPGFFLWSNPVFFVGRFNIRVNFTRFCNTD